MRKTAYIFAEFRENMFCKRARYVRAVTRSASLNRALGVNFADVRLAALVQQIDPAVVQPQHFGATERRIQKFFGRVCKATLSARLHVGAEVMVVFPSHAGDDFAADDEHAQVLPAPAHTLLEQVRIQLEFLGDRLQLRKILHQPHVHAPAAEALLRDERKTQPRRDALQKIFAHGGVGIIAQRRGNRIWQVQPLPGQAQYM